MHGPRFALFSMGASCGVVLIPELQIGSAKERTSVRKYLANLLDRSCVDPQSPTGDDGGMRVEKANERDGGLSFWAAGLGFMG